MPRESPPTLAEQISRTTREALIQALSAHETAGEAAAELGVSLRTVMRLAAEHLSHHDRDVIAKARAKRVSAATMTYVS